MNVKEHFAGKRGICASCQAKVDIPLQSTVEKRKKNKAGVGVSAEIQSAKSQAEEMTLGGGTTVLTAPVADPIAEARHLQWHVLPPGGQTPYGPAAAEVFLEWIGQGRVSPDAMVWRQDWPGWQRAGDVLPRHLNVAASQATFPPEPLIAVAPIAAAVITAAVPVASPITAAGPSFEMPTAVRETSSADLAAWNVRQQRQKHKTATRVAIVVLSLIILTLVPLVYVVLNR
jgi:hypothetical protein